MLFKNAGRNGTEEAIRHHAYHGVGTVSERNCPPDRGGIAVEQALPYPVAQDRHVRPPFPILIGIFEATSIDRRVKGYPSPRPLTHDLIVNVVENLGGDSYSTGIYNGGASPRGESQQGGD